MKTIVLYDNNWHGHHPTYLRLVARAFLEAGCNVWLFSQDSTRIQWWLSEHADYSSKLITVDIRKYNEKFFFPVSLIFYGMVNWFYAYYQIQKIEKKTSESPDIVFFLKLDDFSKGVVPGVLVDQFFPYKWSGIYIHLKFPGFFNTPWIRRYLIQPLSIFSSRKCIGPFIFQEDCIADLNSFIRKPVFQFPDITDESPPEDNHLIKKIKTLAKGRTIVGLIGGQGKRKGSFTLLKIAKELKNENLFFLFIGKMNYSKIENEIEQLKKIIGDPDDWNNCFFHFETIENEAVFNSLFNVSDIIYAVYNNFQYSSNIMTKAALFKKPILVSAGSLMEKRVSEYGTGISCNEHQIDDIISSILLLSENELCKPQYDKYLDIHKLHKLKNAINQLLHVSMTNFRF